jgi:heme exporter protein C
VIEDDAMVTAGPAWLPRNQLMVSGLMVALLSAAILMIFLSAPLETTLGDAQRIVYLYVSVAWCGLAAFLGLGLAGLVYLVRCDLAWDHWSRAAAETGWLCSTLTLFTGAMWTHETRNAWWTWDPRLTIALILWALYGVYFLLRCSLHEPQRRARLGAVLAVFGTLNIPWLLLAAHWLSGQPLAALSVSPRMQLVAAVSVLGFTAFFACLTVQRRWQLGLEEQAAALEWRLDAAPRVFGMEDVPVSRI